MKEDRIRYMDRHHVLTREEFDGEAEILMSTRNELMATIEALAEALASCVIWDGEKYQHVAPWNAKHGNFSEAKLENLRGKGWIE